LKPGGRLDVMAAKDKGGSRLKKELEAFGVEVGESAKAHHRRCVVIRPETVTGLDEAIAAGAPRLVEGLEAWSQPGVFAWDRIDAGSLLLAQALPPLKGAGVDLGCGYGALATVVLALNGAGAMSLVLPQVLAAVAKTTAYAWTCTRDIQRNPRHRTRSRRRPPRPRQLTEVC
jgi:16S rRNA (guanine1207-N2)-methyltransferase